MIPRAIWPHPRQAAIGSPWTTKRYENELSLQTGQRRLDDASGVFFWIGNMSLASQPNTSLHAGVPSALCGLKGRKPIVRYWHHILPRAGAPARLNHPLT